MSGAIFLSASVPDPARSPEFAATSDTVAITAAVSSLIHVTLGRRKLIWGGHPAITPMIHVIAQEYGVDYGKWVTLYQSRYFADEYPEDNKRFKNVVEVEADADGREASLATMRERMLGENDFDAAVFIGGMKGILDEYKLFIELQPRATVVPIASTGGASLSLAEIANTHDSALETDLNYVRLLHEKLGIPVAEMRFVTPDEQPLSLEDRLQKTEYEG